MINAGYPEWIIGARLVEICVVNTHAPLPIFLLHHDGICQPVGMVNLLDEVGGRELCELISYGLFRSCANR